VDSSVLLGLLNPADACHAAATAALQSRIEHEIVVPASVFSEILVLAERRGEAIVQRTINAVDDVAAQILPLDREIAHLAARIRAKHPAVRLPDALVIASGQALVAEVLTAGKQWRGVDDRITVLTP
ncbi:MAG: type II toxin-antitoxin system VapC family toxin, partial [Stackebrandtia sp.]